MMARKFRLLASLLGGMSVLAGCVADPALSVAPGAGKTHADLQRDDAACRATQAGTAATTSATSISVSRPRAKWSLQTGRWRTRSTPPTLMRIRIRTDTRTTDIHIQRLIWASASGSGSAPITVMAGIAAGSTADRLRQDWLGYAVDEFDEAKAVDAVKRDRNAAEQPGRLRLAKREDAMAGCFDRCQG